jgi:hypothetical protein
VHLNIPPIVPYVVGAALVLFGGVRIKYLAAPREQRPSQLSDDDHGATDGRPVRGKEQRRHLRMGVLWILMGLFLLVSTYFQVRRGR